MSNQTPPAAATRELTKTLIKGSPSYAVVQEGLTVARAHCVHVKLNKFTLVIGQRWAGIGTEAEIVAKLQAITAATDARDAA